MPPSRSLVRVVILAALAPVIPLVLLSSAGTAAAADPPSPTPSCRPICLPPPTTPPPVSPSSATTSQPPSPASTPSPSATATAAPTHTVSRKPRARSTYSVAPGSTGNPVTETIGVGAIRGTLPPTLPAAPVADVKKKSSDSLGRIVKLVLGGAVLLLLAGLTGLYLTRHRHGH